VFFRRIWKKNAFTSRTNSYLHEPISTPTRTNLINIPWIPGYPTKVVVIQFEMEYASQFGIMRQKAAEEKLSFIKVLDYYRDRLLNLHAAEPNMQPNIQQFRAEYQTWSSFCEHLSACLRKLVLTRDRA
jgi:hypothetical protein